MTLTELSHTILLLHKHAMSKVRLARVIYFVHKELVRKKLMQIEDISYIRSPLGPIPNGFATLADNHSNIISRRSASINLSYDAEEYLVNRSEDEHDLETTMLEQYRDALKAIEHTLVALAKYTTPELVEASHHEPSWNAHSNGEIYYITNADLKVLFPFSVILPPNIRIRLNRAPANKIGALQATLLRGMVADIVKESTDLEYPDDPNTKNTPSPQNPHPIKRITIKLPTIHLKLFRKNPPSPAKPSNSTNPQTTRGETTGNQQKNSNSTGSQVTENQPKASTNTGLQATEDQSETAAAAKILEKDQSSETSATATSLAGNQPESEHSHNHQTGKHQKSQPSSSFPTDQSTDSHSTQTHSPQKPNIDRTKPTQGN